MLSPEDYVLPDGRYYYDNAATTKMSAKALQVYNETAERWFMNPMSYKDFDPEIERLLEGARQHVVEFLGGDPYRDKVIFTSGATESINLLLKGYFFAHFQEKRKIITSPIEHKAVLETVKYLESVGAEVEYVNIDSEGVVDYQHLKELIDDKTLFVCLMHVNNETGEITDLERVHALCASQKVPFFTDTTQSITKVEVNAEYFEACVGSAHKFRGPKGVGFLFLKDNINLQASMFGGAQEFGIRPGSHSLPLILSAISQLDSVLDADYSKLIDHVEKRFLQKGILFSSLGRKTISYINAYNVKTLNTGDLYGLTKVLPDLIFGFGSACKSGVLGKSHVYGSIWPKKDIIRFSY